MNFYVYQLRVEDEEQPFYIGKSFIGSKRLVEHFSESRGRGAKSKFMKSRKIQKAWREGKLVLEEKLAMVETEKMAHTLEVELIKKYGRRDIGTGILCNHTDGGEGIVGQVIGLETRKKMSEAKMGNKTNVGRKRPDFAEKWKKPITMFSEDGTVLKHYESSIECVKETGIHKATISDCLVGKCKTVKSPKGDVFRFEFGFLTESLGPIKHRQHNGLGKVQQITKDGVIINEFRTSTEAGQLTGIAGTSIRNCIHGKSKTAGGFIWKLLTKT